MGILSYVAGKLQSNSVQVALVDDVVGVDQTWQNMTTQRVNGVSYVNDTGKPISVSWTGTGNLNTFCILNVDAQGIQGSQIYANTAYSIVTGIIIPVGSTYSINFPVGNLVSTWLELREVV